MRKALMNVLMFILLANQVLHIFGKLTILRGVIQPYLLRYNRKLICYSENDGSALVWNDNLIEKYYAIKRNSERQFRSLSKFSNKEIDCTLDAPYSCLESWNRQDWSLTNSFKTPMGPVFDQRWEEFKEYEHLRDKYEYINLPTANAAAISLSIRASRDVYIFLCNSKNYNHDLCYWIIIGGWDNTLSIIRKCAWGGPVPGTFSNRKCQDEISFVKHRPLSPFEWRTFVITWNSTTHNITVYDTKKIIMTYVDHEIRGNYRVFIRSKKIMLLRFHIYDFLHTTVQNATLTSPVFESDNGKICMQLTIGLCAECDAHIVLRNITSHEVLQKIIVYGSSKAAVHGLPMWQSVKIEKNFSMNAYSNLTIQLIPKLNKASSKPLWAITNVRQCPPNESLRFGVLYITEDRTKDLQYFWPDVTCQKLFYDKHTVVFSTSSVDQYIQIDDDNCPEGKIGPQCSFSCKNDLRSDTDCKYIAICHENGCACPPGFVGSSCSQFCQPGTYGSRCKKMCGSCNSNSFLNPCNKITGACYNGCRNTRKSYLQPLCQISIDQTIAPIITFMNKTTIEATYPTIWNEYNEEIIYYSFGISSDSSKKPDYYFRHPWNIISRNATQLVGHFDKLKPGTTYQINCGFSFGSSKVYSQPQNIETDCDPIKDFDVTFEDSNLTINWQNNSDKLYSCPANGYRLVVRNVDANIQVVNESVTSFPYKLLNLSSYTTFNLTVFYRNQKLFTQEIRTQQGVPSKVLDVQIMSSDRQFTVKWKPPDKPNGEIVRYEVILKVKQYNGCEDLKLATPENRTITKSTTNTSITIRHLHPFTSYNVQITIHNSQCSSTSEEATFETERSEIPTEVFNQLTVRDWKMSWSPPEDCRMISGPITARIKIRGISDAVKNFNVTRQTEDYYLDLDKIKPPLNGVEQYIATIYVVRDLSSPENISAYREYKFETPPKAPPSIINLEVVETDTRQNPAMIHLRWQSPLPPFNGKLRNYAIQSCDKSDGHCEIFEVQLNDFCDLWDNYICGNIQKSSENSKTIQVVAYNVNVTESSPSTLVTDEMLNNTTPEVPGDYTFLINDNSVVDLKWRHPWKTGYHLQSFYIRVAEISSNLTKHISQSPKIYEYPVTNYMPNYSERLYLFPSTQYHIYIKAVTIANESSNSKYTELLTPATVAFDGDVNITIQKSNSLVKLNIPPVLNDTKDSMMHIIIKGPNPCEQYSKVPETLRGKISMNASDIAWHAAEVLTSELAGKQFTIGDNKTYGNAINCPLKIETLTLYEITIIVTGSNTLTDSFVFATSIYIGNEPAIHHEVWIIPVMLVIVVATIVLYFYRRKRNKLHKQRETIKEETNILWNNDNSLSYILKKMDNLYKD